MTSKLGVPTLKGQVSESLSMLKVKLCFAFVMVNFST